jgi:hypothetical protein
MRMLASLVVAGALSTVAVADDAAVKMTRAELQSFLPGTKVTHLNKGGSLRRWTNEADGTLVASSDNKVKGGPTARRAVLRVEPGWSMRMANIASISTGRM